MLCRINGTASSENEKPLTNSELMIVTGRAFISANIYAQYLADTETNIFYAVFDRIKLIFVLYVFSCGICGNFEKKNLSQH